MRTAPDCADGTKRVPEQEYSILAGVAQHQRRHSCFMLDALVVVKVGVTVYHLIGYRKDRRFVSERLDEAVPRKRFVILDTHDGIGVVNVRYLMPVIVYDSGSRFLEAAFFVLCENRK